MDGIGCDVWLFWVAEILFVVMGNGRWVLELPGQKAKGERDLTACLRRRDCFLRGSCSTGRGRALRGLTNHQETLIEPLNSLCSDHYTRPNILLLLLLLALCLTFSSLNRPHNTHRPNNQHLPNLFLWTCSTRPSNPSPLYRQPLGIRPPNHLPPIPGHHNHLR